MYEHNCMFAYTTSLTCDRLLSIGDASCLGMSESDQAECFISSWMKVVEGQLYPADSTLGGTAPSIDAVFSLRYKSSEFDKLNIKALCFSQMILSVTITLEEEKTTLHDTKDLGLHFPCRHLCELTASESSILLNIYEDDEYV